MIPNYQAFMRPFLEIAEAANGDEVKLRDVINQLADKFELTEQEREETLPSGKQSVLDNRVGWARTYLTKAKLLEATRRAHFVITPRGKKALSETTSNIDQNYLKQFDEFVAFKEKSNEVETSSIENSLDTASTDETSTPDEILRAAYKTINELY